MEWWQIIFIGIGVWTIPAALVIAVEIYTEGELDVETAIMIPLALLFGWVIAVAIGSELYQQHKGKMLWRSVKELPPKRPSKYKAGGWVSED